jgi:hypothetical protein
METPLIFIITLSKRSVRSPDHQTTIGATREYRPRFQERFQLLLVLKKLARALEEFGLVLKEKRHGRYMLAPSCSNVLSGNCRHPLMLSFPSIDYLAQG